MADVGLSVAEANTIEWNEFEAIAKAHNKKLERESQESWIQTRKIAHAALFPHTKGRLKETDVIKFHWDYANTRKVMSHEEMKNKLEEIAIRKKLNGK